MKLEVGDRVKIANDYIAYECNIERVTDTKAVASLINGNGLRIELKREYENPDILHPFKKIRYDRTRYKLISKNQETPEDPCISIEGLQKNEALCRPG